MTERIDYSRVLNPSQMEAVMTLEGPVLVIAGAGSGKTRTLVYRVARLVETGVDPEAILLLTFTRKASQEMLDRAAHLADSRCRFVSGGTFHSLAHRVLREHADRLGLSRSFAILDRADMEEILQSLVSELHLPRGTPRFPKRGTLANMVSKAANLQQPLERLVDDEYPQFMEFIPYIVQLAALYGEYKWAHDMADYDDLLLLLRRLLAEEEAVREQLSRRYTHIMVDEYQDTNRIQADIVGHLGSRHRNVMVVGDDAQAIYSFRGADYRNMFEFPREFPEAKTIKLEQNYRSTQPILDLTNAIMNPAQEKYTKCLFTLRSGGQLPRLVDTRTEPEQALYVCRDIQAQLRHGRSLRELAVLFRAAYHSFQLETELARQGIRYVKYGGFKFLESAHIKDFLAHLRVAVYPGDAVSWVRVLRLVKNVGQQKSRAIIEWMRKEAVPPAKVAGWPGAGRVTRGLKALGDLLGDVVDMVRAPQEAVERVMQYYAPLLEERFDDHPRRLRELEQLAPMAARYRAMRSFLDDLILEPPNSSHEPDSGAKNDFLTLSTVHSAKGLEWPVVYIIWVSEGRFPAVRSYKNPLALEEERRLMYVAATRAKDELVLCYPGREGLPAWAVAAGAGNASGGMVSSFLQGLPRGVVAHEAAQTARPGFERRDETAAPGPEPPGAFSTGDRVRHPAFGTGVVSKFLGEDRVEVLFRRFGRKLLHLGYTTLEKV